MNTNLSTVIRDLHSSHIEFRPKSWIDFMKAGCYTYAINLKYNEFFLVGDFIGKRCTEKVSDEFLISILIEELEYLGYKSIPCQTESNVDKNQFKIYLQREEHTGYYHFLREDNDGIWSHKFPNELPIRSDSIGQIIEDPDCMVEAPFSGWCFILEKK